MKLSDIIKKNQTIKSLCFNIKFFNLMNNTELICLSYVYKIVIIKTKPRLVK